MTLFNDKVALLTLEWLPYAQIHISITSVLHISDLECLICVQ